jgi:hypothetical protein
MVCKLDISTSDIDEQRGPGNMFTGYDLWLFHSETHGEVKCPNSLKCVNVEIKMTSGEGNFLNYGDCGWDEWRR